MGNVVGSTTTNFCDFFSSPKNSYILGLWCADGYSRTSSVGISNTNPKIVEAFIHFFGEYFPKNRFKLGIYCPNCAHKIDQTILKQVEEPKKYSSEKATKPAYHFYVNSRPFLRDFEEARKNLRNLQRIDAIKAYLAGRFDGDGSINKDMKSHCRIVYGKRKEAEIDKYLFKKIGINETSIYHYKSANTFCLYIYRNQVNRFLEAVRPYSKRL